MPDSRKPYKPDNSKLARISSRRPKMLQKARDSKIHEKLEGYNQISHCLDIHQPNVSKPIIFETKEKTSQSFYRRVSKLQDVVENPYFSIFGCHGFTHGHRRIQVRRLQIVRHFEFQ